MVPTLGDFYYYIKDLTVIITAWHELSTGSNLTMIESDWMSTVTFSGELLSLILLIVFLPLLNDKLVVLDKVGV